MSTDDDRIIMGLGSGRNPFTEDVCETCGKPVREGLRYCSGLSECWWLGWQLRLAEPIYCPTPEERVRQLRAQEARAWAAWVEVKNKLAKAEEYALSAKAAAATMIITTEAP